MHLVFGGSQADLRQLVLVVELSLHLLRLHLSALLAAADATPGPMGGPRAHIVVPHLEALQRFSATAGGALAPIADLREASDDKAPAAVDLTFASKMAAKVEQLLLDPSGF